MGCFDSKVQYKSLGNWHRQGLERDRHTEVRATERERPIANAKNKKSDRPVTNPIRIPSKNPPNSLPVSKNKNKRAS